MSTGPAPLRDSRQDELLDPYAEADAPTPKLSAWTNIELKLMILEPGDHALLAKLLEAHPDLRDEIIAEATQYVGNETCARALEIVSGAAANEVTPPQQEADAGKDDEDALLLLMILEPGDHELLATFLRNHPHLHDRAIEEVLPNVGEETVQRALEILAGGGENQVQPPQQQVDEPEPEPPTEVAPAEAAPAEQVVEPGWVTRARAYNRAHAALVEEFNALTGYACVDHVAWLESGGEVVVDPNEVARWQVDHGVSPDGRVGEATVAAARRLKDGEVDVPAPEALADELE